MQILLVSDLHYTLKQLDWVASVAGDFDLVVVAGDLLDISSIVEPDAMVRRHLLGEVLTMRAPYRTSRIHRSLMETIVPSSPARPWTVTRAAAS